MNNGLTIPEQFEAFYFGLKDDESVRLAEKLSYCFGRNMLRNQCICIYIVSILPADTVSQRHIAKRRMLMEFSFSKELRLEYLKRANGDTLCIGLFELDLDRLDEYEMVMFSYPAFNYSTSVLLFGSAKCLLDVAMFNGLNGVLGSSNSVYFPEKGFHAMLNLLLEFDGISMAFGFGGDEDVFLERFVRVFRRG